MKKKQYLLSETEMEILEMLWKIDAPIKCAELLRIFNENGKEWKRQTLNTFITRIKNKGIVKVEKRTIYVLYDRTEFQKVQAQSILNDMYGGEIRNFLTAFTGNEVSTEEEKQELLRMIEEQPKKARKKK